MKDKELKKFTLELIIATGLIVAGITLLFLGFYAVPLGEISASVLTAFGETGTFAGAILGVDYSYRFKMFKYKEDNKEKEDD